MVFEKTTKAAALSLFSSIRLLELGLNWGQTRLSTGLPGGGGGGANSKKVGVGWGVNLDHASSNRGETGIIDMSCKNRENRAS